MPVNEWQGCLYDKIQKITYKVTTSFTSKFKEYLTLLKPSSILLLNQDPNLWSPASGPASFPSVPVQMIVQSKTQDGFVNTDISSITRFRTFLTLEEENYMVKFEKHAF